MTKYAVGIVLGLKEAEKNAVLLQQRTADDSFARGTQVSAHGKLTPQEALFASDFNNQGFKKALKRKINVELGPVVLALIVANEESLVVLKEEKREDKHVITYGLNTKLQSEDLLNRIQIGDEVGGVIVKTSTKDIRPYTIGEKEDGVPEGEIAMFPDEIEAVELAFKKLFN